MDMANKNFMKPGRGKVDITQYDDIYEYMQDRADENDEFWGEDLDTEKEQAIKKADSLCKEIASQNRAITYKWTPLHHNERHAIFQLKTSKAGYVLLGKRTLDLFAELFKVSDMHSVHALGEVININFIVADIWNKCGTVHDKP